MNNIFKLCLVLLILIGTSACVSAQGIPVAAGGNATGSGGTVSYSVGEVVYATKKTASGVVIEGIQQAYTSTELPISLLQFTATVVNKLQVQLNWETASETNNAYFEVERSTDGVSFSNVVTVKSKGNSASTLEYDAVDNTPETGISYYRLKQVDIIGKSTYSKSIAVSITPTEKELKVYPNPTTTILNLQISDATSRSLTYTLYTINGKLIEQQQINSNTTTITTSGLANGTYLLQVKDKSTLIKSFKIIKN